MAAGDEMKARYVDTDPGELWKAREPGTFCRGRVAGHEGSIVLFLVLPNGAIGSVRNAGDNPGAIWQIHDHGDDTYTVSPSIWANPNSANPNEPEWHGYLEAGVFREV